MPEIEIATLMNMSDVDLSIYLSQLTVSECTLASDLLIAAADVLFYSMPFKGDIETVRVIWKCVIYGSRFLADDRSLMPILGNHGDNNIYDPRLITLEAICRRIKIFGRPNPIILQRVCEIYRAFIDNDVFNVYSRNQTQHCPLSITLKCFMVMKSDDRLCKNELLSKGVPQRFLDSLKFILGLKIADRELLTWIIENEMDLVRG